VTHMRTHNAKGAVAVPALCIWYYEYACASPDLLNAVRGHGNQK